ncbi:hypothetical protein MKX03_005506 [Papaver bracteatum]|nr:hypothetical protein MKX03_005506 [Papaver bracteatum]
MLKTELCNKWYQTGVCQYGKHCRFAHGIHELRPVIRHPRYKTKVCRMVLSGGTCRYGHRCHFRHALTDQEKRTGIAQSTTRNLAYCSSQWLWHKPQFIPQFFCVLVPQQPIWQEVYLRT